MISSKFVWEVGYTSDAAVPPAEMLPAAVPGAVQLDYARAKGMPDVHYGVNFRDYAWMEDVCWVYRTTLDFTLAHDQMAHLCFHGIDYRYAIRIDGREIACGEGMFTPVVCDVSAYAAHPHVLEVVLFPVPKADDSNTRSQARLCCKPAACYGWDWHPRFVTSGLFDEVELLIRDRRCLTHLQTRYALTPSLDSCRLTVDFDLEAAGTVCVQLWDDPEGEDPAATRTERCEAGACRIQLSVASPRLWFPEGYGPQSLYTLRVFTQDSHGNRIEEETRKIGFRRVRLLMNDDGWFYPKDFPKSRSDAPATLEINGVRVFAKGSNWVNAGLCPGALTDDDYAERLSLAHDAHMNMLRIWGGGFVNHPHFFELCDELGIMVWQEFPLACNEYPDDDHYLSILRQEATSIVRKLRSHPSVVLWCGGNELFNGWSKMTEQHHALRLLDAVCYAEDRFTPFIMTSPLNGMGHGHYYNYDEQTQEEFITTLVRSSCTAYTEFGSPGAASADYIRRFMSDADFEDCHAENEVWAAHHAFGAWGTAGARSEAWLRGPEAEYFFGGYRDTDDLCNKTRFIQAMCYRSHFEEMRRQWPRCSMALNWCFNEPWPCFANNSLLSWPTEPKPSYYAVREALRPRLSSLRITRHLWWSGEIFRAEVWLLNDSREDVAPTTVDVFYTVGDGGRQKWGSLFSQRLPAQQNALLGTICFPLPAAFSGQFQVELAVRDDPELNSSYTYLCRTRVTSSTAGMLNL